MAGLNCIITGATSGLGFHTLKRLLRSGSFDYIIGLGRDIKKSEEALGELPQNNTNVEFVECDLSEVEAVKKFATSVMTKLPKIDLLVNVAGIMDSPTLVHYLC
jgi:NAD(P)-dependent dehydrogenase (short-subunit alcohol dehydrogenase family)